ncbi:MAG TPA: APC family permease [Kofleriaceae bacterium]|nr:APC family permease [Kofleriaceae bacterium]
MLGWKTGTGLVIANMVGAGVFLSMGFMAQDLGPGQILVVWLVGALLAFAGVGTYAAAARLVPHSGGEYRYLSNLLHPSVGYLAGWASLLVGFSAPIAVDAYAVGAFSTTLGFPVDPRVTGAVVIVAVSVMHGLTGRSSRALQNVLVVVKLALIIGFVCVGMAYGDHRFPAWHPPHDTATNATLFGAFATSLFYVAFAFSGWNAAAYAAGDFHEPKKHVPRAMLIGCALVALLYLLLNWVFIANLTPESSAVVFDYDTAHVTLGHVVAQQIAGDTAATIISVVIIIAFISAISAMVFTGPRVYAAMARDGYLPRTLAAEDKRPPRAALIFQAGIALVILFAYELQQVLSNVGAMLMLFSGLVALALFLVPRDKPRAERPGPVALTCAGIYLGATSVLLVIGFRESLHLVAWVGGICVVGLIAYVISEATRKPQVPVPVRVEAEDVPTLRPEPVSSDDLG